MNTAELKSLLQQIRDEEPEFLAELIGEVVKDNLQLREQGRGLYDNLETPAPLKLSWGPNNQGAEDFSYV